VRVSPGVGATAGATGPPWDAAGSGAGGPARVRRLTPAGSLTVHFDDSMLAARRRTFNATAAITLGGMFLGTVLLLLYLKRILSPIDAMLSHAEEFEARSGEVDEAEYLVDTFRKSVDLLKAQKSELEQLHRAEKSRADDLERITATLTRSITAGFIAIDRDARIVRLNSAAREILGIDDGTPAEGSAIAELFGGSELGATLTSALEHRENLVRHESRLVRGGATSTVGLTTVPLVDDRLDYLGAIVIIADLTEVRSLETRVRELQSLADLGEMSAGIAHEFRNSLATILGYLRLLRKGELADEAMARLRNAEDEAEQLAKAVEALLRFAGPIEPHVARVELEQVVAPIVARLRSDHPAIAFVVDGDWFPVAGDAALLSRMFENLLLNAVDAVEEKGGANGRIEVRAHSGEGRRVEIVDNGVGLDPADANRLFLPFQSGKAKGFGLGLSLARKIALVHGGRIEIGGSPGEGARIGVLLPETAEITRDM